MCGYYGYTYGYHGDMYGYYGYTYGYYGYTYGYMYGYYGYLYSTAHEVEVPEVIQGLQEAGHELLGVDVRVTEVVDTEGAQAVAV